MKPNKLNKTILFLETIPKLGFLNVAYVAWYRLTLKTGLRKLCFKQKTFENKTAFFSETKTRSDYPAEWKEQLTKDAKKIIKGETRYYAYHWKQTGNPPNWFLNPFNGAEYPNTNLHWTKLPDFNPELGDIKNVWEASRFEWVITLAMAYSVTGEKIYLDTLNYWLADWVEKNPFNTGPNWKCGQETSFRLFNLLNATVILKQYNHPSESLQDFIYQSLERINGNILYAIAQDNNHGTSEAAALFIGGSYLSGIDADKYPKAKAYSKKGRRWLENRVKKLIEADGSFSQHSVNYHRVLLDTLSFAELWRMKTQQAPFSPLFYSRAKTATNWLFQLSDTVSGDAPNLGANDGAMLLNMHGADFRDFRPSVQLATALFLKLSRYKKGLWNEPLWWFDEEIDSYKEDQRFPKSELLPAGYVRLNGSDSWALIRFPYFKFRPSHNDVFHFDLWYQGKNILCDAGTYSYNPPKNEIDFDFKSVHAHNTVSFDSQEQMPKVSRFLLGKWIKPEKVGKIVNENSGEISWTGSYIDAYKNRHERKISIIKNTWKIEDRLSGPFQKATIGFNTNSPKPNIKGNILYAGFGNIEAPESGKLSLEESFISTHYFEKLPLSLLKIEINKPGTYTTIIHLEG